MAHIGTFRRTVDGYAGRLHTLTVDVSLVLVQSGMGDAPNAPAWRIHLGEDASGPEVGAGWKRTSEKAGAYIAVQIDDPALLLPIRANLFHAGEDGEVFHLLWNRPSRRAENRSAPASEASGA